MTFAQCIVNVLIADNRTCDQLREQRYICTDNNRILLHTRITAVNVDDIRHDLERIERNTDRQRQTERRNVDKRDFRQVFGKEVEILEKSEQTEVDNHADDQNDFCTFVIGIPVFTDVITAHIVKEHGKDHQKYINGFAPAVEEQADEQNPEIAQLDRCDKIDQQDDRQVGKQKLKARKEHVVPPLGVILYEVHTAYMYSISNFPQ